MKGVAVDLTQGGVATPKWILPVVVSTISTITALAEVTTTAEAWRACHVGGLSIAEVGLLLVHALVLVLIQTAAVTGLCLFVAKVAGHRVAATVCAIVLATCLTAAVAWCYFALSGLPMSCGSLHPSWWPRWLPPTTRVVPGLWGTASRIPLSTGHIHLPARSGGHKCQKNSLSWPARSGPRPVNRSGYRFSLNLTARSEGRTYSPFLRETSFDF